MKKMLIILLAICLLLPSVCLAERYYLERKEENVAPTDSIHCYYHPNANLVYRHGSYVIQGDDWVHYYYPYSHYTCTVCGETVWEGGDEQEQTHTFVDGECIVCHYRRFPAPNPNPTSAPTSQPSPDFAGWDTQFKEGFTQNNPYLYQNLTYLRDGNLSTQFFYTIWKSERTDNIPEFTVYFNNSTVSRIGIVNGQISSADQYNQHARARNITVKIYSSSGKTETRIMVPDNYTRDYQWFSLGGTYSGVTKIELFFEDYYIGQGSTKYEMNITEISFS